MYIHNKLNKAVRLAIAFGATSATALAVPAFAQTQDDGAKVERISITGSRIQRTDLETASPITVFSAVDIAASGHVTVEKFIHSIPAINGGVNGQNTNNGSGGAASANLRGLGASRTLILINGRRYASGDLNSIPMSFIERVEVLRDGASTIYGSDAIAGVINFITKRDFDGAEFTAQYDVTGQGDGETTRLAATIGASSAKGNVVLGLEYSKRNAIGQGDREFSATPWTERGGRLVSGGSDANSFGSWSSMTPGSAYADDLFVVDPGTGAVRPYNGDTDAYNFATASYLVTPQEVFSINAAASYEVSNSVKAFLEGGFTNRQSNQLMGADGTFWGAVVAADHPNNPIGEPIALSRRLTETGGRQFTQDFSDYRMVLGLEGELDNGWAWDISYNYARFVTTTLDLGRANPSRFNNMLDPAKCAADAACPGLWNPFVADSLTSEQLAYGSIPNSPVTKGTTKQLMANLTGDTGDFALPAGSIGWAVGVEKRWEDYQSIPDGGAAIGQIYGVTGSPTSGSYDLQEAYVEFNVPLLSDLPGVQRLDLSAAARRTDYNFLSAETTTKFGLEYVPFSSLLVRATYADGFRAPAITELYGARSESNINYVDPCLEYGTTNAGNVSDALRANCLAEGLPAGFSLTNNQSTTTVGGNSDLKPEESTSITLGFVYTPEFISNFSLAIDYYDIEIEDGIGRADITSVISQCYNSTNFSSPECSKIQGPGAYDRPPLQGSQYRDFNRRVTGVLAVNDNISTFKTSGFDFDASWFTELGGGKLTLKLDGTYLDKYTYQVQAGAPISELAGKFGGDVNFGGRVVAFPKWRTNLSAGFSTDTWDVSWVARYIDSTDDIAARATKLRNTTGTVVYHDVQGSYHLDNVTFTLGARNVFDKQPPYVTNNNDMNTLNSTYDTAGQYWYARVSAKF